jgi:hypothetical protein
MGTTIVTTETQSLRDSTSCIANGTDRKYATNEIAESSDSKFWGQIVWRNVLIFLYVHFAALYGLYLAFTKIKGLTILWGEYFNFIAMNFIYMCTCAFMYTHCLVYVYIHIFILCVCVRVWYKIFPTVSFPPILSDDST